MPPSSRETQRVSAWSQPPSIGDARHFGVWTCHATSSRSPSPQRSIGVAEIETREAAPETAARRSRSASRGCSTFVQKAFGSQASEPSAGSHVRSRSLTAAARCYSAENQGICSSIKRHPGTAGSSTAQPSTKAMQADHNVSTETFSSRGGETKGSKARASSAEGLDPKDHQVCFGAGNVRATHRRCVRERCPEPPTSTGGQPVRPLQPPPRTKLQPRPHLQDTSQCQAQGGVVWAFRGARAQSENHHLRYGIFK